MLPTNLPEDNTWSNTEAQEFGGYDFVRVSIEAHRAFSFLQEKAQCALWLHNLAGRSLIQQDLLHQQGEKGGGSFWGFICTYLRRCC